MKKYESSSIFLQVLKSWHQKRKTMFFTLVAVVSFYFVKIFSTFPFQCTHSILVQCNAFQYIHFNTTLLQDKYLWRATIKRATLLHKWNQRCFTTSLVVTECYCHILVGLCCLFDIDWFVLFVWSSSLLFSFDLRSVWW